MSEPSVWKRVYAWRKALLQPDSGLSSTERLVGLVLSMEMSPECQARGGADRLAKAGAIHPQTVRQALGSLERKGWLELLERGGLRGEAKRANVYQAHISTRSHERPVVEDMSGPLVQDYPIPFSPLLNNPPNDPESWATCPDCDGDGRVLPVLTNVVEVCELCLGRGALPIIEIPL